MKIGQLATWFSDLDIGAKGALGFLALVILLTVYAFRHWAQRRKALEEMMPKLGFRQIEEPANELVPEELFYPNGFDEDHARLGITDDLFRKASIAWTGRLVDRDVTVMDVSISRRRRKRTGDSADSIQVNQTVIRSDPGVEEGPPNLLIEERVLFKSKVRHQRSLDGVEQFGEHYFLFSDAPESQLAAWVTPQVREALSAHRLWHIAAHDGVWYLSRGSSREEPRQMESFLREGGFLLSALLPEARKT